ncbi:MAG: hypothetical protein QXE64_00165 [Candidatus Pacearchaeota archaeon]
MTKVEKIFISKEALIRQSKDRFVTEHLADFLDEIRLIALSEGKRPTERIGEFNISPRGHTKIRIAWHREGEDIYIDDFLYHKGEDYVDKWNIKAAKGKITRKDYSSYTKLPISALLNDNKPDVESYKNFLRQAS